MPEPDAQQLVDIIDDAIRNFRGDTFELRGAIGALMMARRFGWKPLLLMVDKRSIQKYERILGVSFRDYAPEVGDCAEKSVGWQAVQKVSNFWKAVKGEISGIRSSDVR